MSMSTFVYSCRFQAWPLDALEAVALKFLQDVTGLEASTRRELVKLCQAFHQHIAHVSTEYLQARALALLVSIAVGTWCPLTTS